MTTGSLYVHLPFCLSKCGYCHFATLPKKDALIQAYIDLLQQEYHHKKNYFVPQNTLYFGGGTPSVLDPQNFSKIFHLFVGNFTEITVEVNPEDVTQELMEFYHGLGVNRISMGVQSLDDRELTFLERKAKAKKAIKAMEIIGNSPINNLSIDLMYDIPYQSVSSWKKTLDHLQNLPIQHLSLYNLQIEMPSHFYYKKDAIKTSMPDEEESLALYEMTLEKLQEIGLFRYEISAFAREGFESRHNLTYWEGKPFLGVGMSAFSYLDHTRFQNAVNFQTYKRLLLHGQDPIEFEETLPVQKRERELLCIALRKVEGTHLESCDEHLFATLHDLQKEQFLLRQGNHLRLTPLGMRFYDDVATALVL